MRKLTIEGMGCEHCVKAVTGALESLGLKNVRVSLDAGAAEFDESGVAESDVRAAIDDAGYELISCE